MINEKLINKKLSKNQKNNRKLAIRRKKRHLSILNRIKLKKKLEKESILENTIQGQINKDFSIEISKENVIEELKLINSYDKIDINDDIYNKLETNEVNQNSNENCIIC